MRNKNTVNRALVAKNFSKLFTLLIMAAMSMGVMADNVSIPQDLGNYIVVGSSTGADGFADYITRTNCQVDSRLGDAGNNKYYTIGTTHGNTTVSMNLSATVAGNYVFGFKTGAGNGSSGVLRIKLTKEGGETPMFTAENISVVDDGNWDPHIQHNFYVENVEAANYVLSIDVTSTTGSYAGNWGNFFFHAMNQLAWPTSSSYMELSDGTFHNARDNSDNVINYISRDGGYIDDLLIYNSEESFHEFHFNIDSYKQKSKVTITLTDFATGIQEAQETVAVESQRDYATKLSTVISAGLKKVRFDFADYDDVNDNSYLYNFRQVYFTTIPELPIYGTSYLDLSAGTFGLEDGANYNKTPSYESGNENIGYNGDGGYAEYYVGNTNPTAHYEFHLGTRRYQDDASFTLSIIDLASETVEVNQDFEVQSGSGYADQTCVLSNAITPGLKKIRIETHSSSDSYAFNYNHVCFKMLKYTREHPHMNLNTLCFPYQIDSYTGATFYTMLYKVEEASVVTDVYLQEHVGALEAGKPYFYVPEGEELVCYYSGAREDTPAEVNGVQGFYENLTTIPSGSYVAYNNLLTVVGENVRMGEYRAYVVMDDVADKDDPGAPALVPGRRLLNIGGHKTPTGVENTSAAAIYGGSQKILRNGQIVIVKGDKMYNMLGQEL